MKCKYISWNINGFRAVLKKGFASIFENFDADFVCLQETKMQAGQAEFAPEGYTAYWNYAERKGYSGTAIFTRHSPERVSYGLGIEALDHEGRVITLEYPSYSLVCVYTPNAQDGLKRIDFRLAWEAAFREYLHTLDLRAPVIVCGDMNVAHHEIDLKNPETNRGHAGFSDEERGAFQALLDKGFTDSYRALYPDQTDAYTWWSFRARARERNVGWRIDYFLVSSRVQDRIQSAGILPEILGSDHCPVSLEIDL